MSSFEVPDASAIYRWLAASRRSPSFAQRASAIYTGVVVGGIFGALVYGTASTALAQVVNAASVARWGPSVMLVVFLGAGFWGTVQGPVVFSPADVAALLGAPLPRGELVARPLRRAFVLGACFGVVAAGVLVAGLTGAGRHMALARVLGLLAGLGVAGMIGVALAWLVSISAAGERALRLMSGPVVVVACGLGLLAALGGRTVALWSGPWGWAVQAGAGVGSSQWIAALAALCVLAVVIVGVVWRRRERGETERFVRRAEGRSHVQASLMAFDVRMSRRNLASVRSVSGGRMREVGWLRAGLSGMGAGRFGRTVEVAVFWRCVVNAVEVPARFVGALALAAGGAAFVLLDVRRAAGLVAGAALIYAAAAWLLEPMRIELDAPGRTSVFLAARPGRALLAHTVLPCVAVAGSVALCAVGLALAGLLGRGDLTAALVLVAAAPAVVCCAGMSARRGGRLPQDLLFTAVTSDPSGGGVVLLGWLLAWPVAAATIVSVPVRAIQVRGSGLGTVVSVAVALAATAVLLSVSARDPRDSG